MHVYSVSNAIPKDSDVVAAGAPVMHSDRVLRSVRSVHQSDCLAAADGLAAEVHFNQLRDSSDEVKS